MAVTFQSLVRKVSQYRANRGEAQVSDNFARLSDEVEQGICAAMSPADRAANCDDGTGSPPRSLPWTDVKRFLLAMTAWASKGLRVVPQEEAVRRASICATCPYNVSTSGCGGCRAALEGLRSSILKESTPLDDKLQACGVCSCDLKLLVHVPLDIAKKGKENLIFPKWCWQNDLVASE